MTEKQQKKFEKIKEDLKQIGLELEIVNKRFVITDENGKKWRMPKNMEEFMCASFDCVQMLHVPYFTEYFLPYEYDAKTY